MRDFAAIDFETANSNRCSVCSMGLVVVRDAEITETYYSLIQPEPNFYHYFCSKVHGLTKSDTENAPIFQHVWENEVVPRIGNLPLVAHNSNFDESCLKAAFKVYQMDYPEYTFYDTLKAARKHFPYLQNHQLHTVAAECGYILENHHHALDDAKACAWIAMSIL